MTSSAVPERKILTVINGIEIKERRLGSLPYNSRLKQFAVQNRRAGHLCEVLFWKHVRNKSFHGLNFVRQKIIGSYIVDFYNKPLGLAIEIDGWIHEYQTESDTIRQLKLERMGVCIFRVNNEDVLYNMHWVHQELENFIIENFK
ncbi:endonuclease domain-containing protein [Chryseobacterium salipaludis]|uniref:endonuclease domain-containing protein n=1 Tax=Chryseobacterium TaxID=59732 RepID=UPI001FF316F2|nr:MULTISPECIES: endonuclease domain-containing protein [Chryseobacterium]MCJ8498620.1 endonuclease domain-containing protein [Chryseobacterium salipaludis]MCX3297730.1 endonuclease domain-containing protein [Planobacterium sp. JC490]